MSILTRLNADDATVAVVGMGYVGLPLAHAFCHAGLRVMGIDVDPVKVASLNAGRGYLTHLGDDFVAGMRRTGRFEAIGDKRRMAEADAVLICVPTPLKPGGFEPDLSFVEQTADEIARVLRPGQLIVLESTTYPGTTRELVQPRLQARGLKSGEDAGFYLAFSPEREDPGRRDYSIKTTPKLVGGVDPASTRAAAALYRRAIDRVIEVSSAEVAESAKLLENIYRAVNIAMVNELKTIFDAMKIDVWEVIEAASTKPFGFQPFHPGPGLGGHCIPIDPFYLSWRARQFGREARFIELAGRVNHEMPAYVVERTLAALSAQGVAAAAARVLVLGLAYKPDIDDVRESPSFELIDLFTERGCRVAYHDPHVPKTHSMRRHGDLNLASVPLDSAGLAGFDAVVISTAHRAVDYTLLAREARLVVDTRHIMAPFAQAMGPRLVQA